MLCCFISFYCPHSHNSHCWCEVIVTPRSTAAHCTGTQINKTEADTPNCQYLQLDESLTVELVYLSAAGKQQIRLNNTNTSNITGWNQTLHFSFSSNFFFVMWEHDITAVKFDRVEQTIPNAPACNHDWTRCFCATDNQIFGTFLHVKAEFRPMKISWPWKQL